MAHRRSVIDTVEAIRRIDLSPQLWLKDVLEALQPSLGSGLGIFGCFFDASNLEGVQFAHGHTVDAPSGTLDAMWKADMDPMTTPEVKLRWFTRPAATISDIFGEAFRSYAPWERYLAPCGVRDLLMINAVDERLSGLAISIPYREVLSHTPQQIALLERITAHLIVANRLRRQLHTMPGVLVDDTVEAIFTPEGRLAHAAGRATLREAREALRTAVEAAERARGRLRRTDPREALELWSAMAAGRWALIDQFDSEGRRYVVARVTDLVSAAPGALSRRESQVAKLAALGHSNKMIAYELGIGVSTVAQYLRRAVAKTGVGSVRELTRRILRARMPSA
jgi:DNA-binding CsgD family transcriptional regulator